MAIWQSVVQLSALCNSLGNRYICETQHFIKMLTVIVFYNIIFFKCVSRDLLHYC